jgi:signal transduction histidine kinase
LKTRAQLGAGTRFLIASGDRLSAGLIRRALTGRYPAAAIHFCDSASRAAQWAAQRKYDVAILGALGSNGDEAATLSSMLRPGSELPVVLVLPEDRKRELEGFLSSPLVRVVTRDPQAAERVVASVEEMLELGRSSRSGEPEQVVDSPRRDTSASIMNIVAGTLSHEINNPLMTIQGMAELILDDSKGCDRETLKKVRIIQRSAKRIQEALHRLRRVSEPAMKETAGGIIIDPKRSRLAARSRSRSE